MADYTTFYNDVVMDCPGVPIPLVQRAVREAFRMFCKDTTAYRYTLNPATDLSYAVSSNVATDVSTGIYTIAVPTGFQLDSVISPMLFNGSYTVYFFTDGSESTSPTPPTGYDLDYSNEYQIFNNLVQGASQQWLDRNVPGWRQDQSDDYVQFFCCLTTNTFQITPDSGIDRSAYLTVNVSMMPDRSALPTLDNEFCNRWFDHITAGSKFLLMAQPNAEWSNPDLAQFYKAKFDDGIDEAKRYIKTGLRNPTADGINHVTLYYR